MPQDIFISYSSRDRESADQLTELLISAGLSVWIDRSGLEVSSSWSSEIVEAINNCTAFIVLLSPASLESHNVIKEVSLASQKRKKILPLDLEPVQLTKDFEYQLAGIQRAPMMNIDSIIRTLGKLGLEATQAPVLKLIKETDFRKSLMILPFEDLSPTADNQWFADGLAAELISVLSNVRALRVTDQQTTKEFKKYGGHLTTYAKEMNIRYFIQGSVRKFGDQIKITSALLDIESGDHLWQDSLKGRMDDIFDIQETVAKKVVDGLNIILTKEEEKKVTKKPTENAEAYELVAKADEYYHRHTKEGFLLSIQLYTEAITLDSNYAIAYASKAHTLANLYRNYDRAPKLLEEGLRLVHIALQLKPNLWKAYNPLSLIYLLQGNNEESERAAIEYNRNEPDDANSYYTLGFFYSQTAQYSKSIAPYEKAIKLNPNNLSAYFNIVISCNKSQDEPKQLEWAAKAIPKSDRRLKLFPDDEDARVNHAILLHFAGRDEEARIFARDHANVKDGKALFNIACLQFDLQDFESGITTFCKAIDAGFRDIRLLHEFLNPPGDIIPKIEGIHDYQKAKQMVKELSGQ